MLLSHFPFAIEGRSANPYTVREKKVLMEERRERIILFPLPLQGHVSPMIQLANILFSRGFSITVIQTSFNSLNPSAYPNFTFHEISDGLQGNQETSTGDLVKFLTVLFEKCEKPFEECLVKVLSEVEDDERAVCLVTDVLWIFPQAISTRLKIPRLVLRTSSASAFLALAASAPLLQNGHLPTANWEEENPVPDLSSLKVKDLPTIKTEIIDGFPRMFYAMFEETKKSAGLILNSCQELEPKSLTKCSQLLGIPIFPIGPFRKQFSAESTSLLLQDPSSISWLNSQAPKSVLYISFGSIAIINQTEFLEMASGLANSNQPFLWVVRPGSVHGSEWLESLPEVVQEKLASKGYIVKWAPQQEVLAHPSVGGFWTHSGWNSSLESICEGVPMICSPRFGDQLVNARYVSNVWKIGLHLEKKLERDEIERCIRKLMDERESDNLRERIKVLKENVELYLSHGGSSFRSLEKLVNYLLFNDLS